MTDEVRCYVVRCHAAMLPCCSGAEHVAAPRTVSKNAVAPRPGTEHVTAASVTAATFIIRRNQRTGYVDSTSLPAGILSSVEFEKSSLKLSAGDLIVMVSDGATASGVDWIRHTIDRFQVSDGLQSLCDDITTTARLKRSDCRDDDITVIAGMLRKR